MQKFQRLVIAFAILNAAAASAQTSPNPPPAAKPAGVITNPDWVKKPTAESLLSVWPVEAMKKGVGGKVVISCKISRQGVLVGCKVVFESPEGMGFGPAAISMTPQFLMTPMLMDGVPVEGGDVQIPINFEDPGSGGGAGEGTWTVITIRRWLNAPTYTQVAAAYPAKARDKKIGGRAVMTCELNANGRLKGCNSLSSQPTGMNVGDAAKTLASYFVGPTTIQGTSTKGMRTQITIIFSPEMLSAGEPMIGKPEWVTLPTQEQLSAAMPTDQGSTGTIRIRLNCLVVADGKVDDCKVQSEDPPGKGLGIKALELAKYFQLTIWSQEGLPTVGGRITIPLRYELGTPTTPLTKP